MFVEIRKEKGPVKCDIICADLTKECSDLAISC